MSIAERKEREKIQRRNDIIDAAEKRFFSKGYDEVAMSDIATDVELNKATLYLYFKNKESLYFAVMIRGLAIMRDMFFRSASKKQSGRECLMELMGAFFSYCKQQPDYYRLMCEARTRRFDMTEVDSAREQIEIAGEITGLFCSAIEDGRRDGSLLKDLDPMEATAFIMASCENAVRPGVELRWILGTRNISPGKHLESALRLTLAALTGERLTERQLAKHYGEFLGEKGVGLW